jgi:orotidine-5'-phosphate decarboxylase
VRKGTKLTTHNPLIVALDVESVEDAIRLVDQISDVVDFYKVGMELYAAAGMSVVERLLNSRKQVFLDLKLYDISETVKRATRQIVKTGPTFLTVHGSGPVMAAAAEGRGDTATQLLAVTVLTSFDRQDLADLGYPTPISDLVALRVKNAIQNGMDGIVCSPRDVATVRRIGGSKLKLVTPGVRSAGAEVGDQKRVATPAEAIRDGADYLVIGRQVTRAVDPRAECEAILQEIAAMSLAS